MKKSLVHTYTYGIFVDITNTNELVSNTNKIQNSITNNEIKILKKYLVNINNLTKSCSIICIE